MAKDIQKTDVAPIAPPKLAGEPLVNEKTEATQTQDQPRDPSTMEHSDLVQALLDSREEAHRATEEAAKSRETARKLNEQVNTGSKAYEQLRRDNDEQAQILRDTEEELKRVQQIALVNENPEAVAAEKTGLREIINAITTGIYASGWNPTAEEGFDPSTKKIAGMKTMAKHIVGMAEVIRAELGNKNL